MPSLLQQAHALDESNCSNGSNQQEQPELDWVTSSYNEYERFVLCVVLIQIHDISNPRIVNSEIFYRHDHWPITFKQIYDLF